MRPFLSLRQAARLLRLSDESVKRLIQGGLLEAHHLPGRRRYYISTRSLARLLEEKTPREEAREE